MNIKPQKGMQEYLPEAAAQRDRLMNLILETYTASGFTRIYTPAIESAENLDKSDGGDNLNLIFRIMKRGDKLAEALAKNPVDEKELCDLGLRYDLTLPLSRYYANNRNSLPSPFKCIQIDKVIHGAAKSSLSPLPLRRFQKSASGSSPCVLTTAGC